MPYRLLVFDLDGTLIDSEQDLAISVNATLAHLGRPPLPVGVIRGFIGNGAAALLDRALGDATIPELDRQAALQFFLAHYRAHKLDNTRLYPQVLETLRSLQRDLPGSVMAVLTNKPVRPSREICEGLGIASFFFEIYGGESLPRKKPDPVGLQTLIREASARLLEAGECALRLEEVVMIGDSAVDIATAHAARVDSVGCTFGLVEAEVVSGAQPTYIAHRPADWLHLLTHGQPQE